MATLRLFASAREAAGISRIEIDGATVGEVLAQASNQFGPQFAAVLAGCKIWLNGEPTEPTSAVCPADEVAVLPPVSGG